MTAHSARKVSGPTAAAQGAGEILGGEHAAEDALLRAWARILREAAEADRAARPALRVVSRTRRHPGRS